MDGEKDCAASETTHWFARPAVLCGQHGAMSEKWMVAGVVELCMTS
jgi:hypothetical protein